MNVVGANTEQLQYNVLFIIAVLQYSLVQI